MTDEPDSNNPENSAFQSQVSSPGAQNAGDQAEDDHAHHNASAIAGETVAIVGESTGRFPRVQHRGGAGESTGKSAFLVGAGILISRIIGVVRQRVFAHYLGISDAAGAFNA